LGELPAAGEVFIHELTHPWQVTHSPFAHDFFWDAAKLAGQAAYNYGPPGTDWSDLRLEAQASIVNEWYPGTNTFMNPKIGRALRAASPVPPVLGGGLMIRTTNTFPATSCLANGQ